MPPIRPPLELPVSLLRWDGFFSPVSLTPPPVVHLRFFTALSFFLPAWERVFPLLLLEGRRVGDFFFPFVPLILGSPTWHFFLRFPFFPLSRWTAHVAGRLLRATGVLLPLPSWLDLKSGRPSPSLPGSKTASTNPLENFDASTLSPSFAHSRRHFPPFNTPVPPWRWRTPFSEGGNSPSVFLPLPFLFKSSFPPFLYDFFFFLPLFFFFCERDPRVVVGVWTICLARLPDGLESASRRCTGGFFVKWSYVGKVSGCRLPLFPFFFFSSSARSRALVYLAVIFYAFSR